MIGTIVVTTSLFFTLQWVRGTRPRWQIAGSAALALSLVLLFLGANLVKVIEGGWLPIGIGLVLFTVFTTWRKGRSLVKIARDEHEGKLQDFVNELHNHQVRVRRVDGAAVFLSRGEGQTPMAMRANVDHNHALHRRTVILTVTTDRTVPRVPAEDQVEVRDLGFSDDGITQVNCRYGYMEHRSLPDIMREAEEKGLEDGDTDLDAISYFVSAPELRITDSPGMAMWRKHLFLATTKLTSDPVEFFNLPRGQTVVMGAELEI